MSHKTFQMDSVLQLYSLELQELAGVGYAFGKIGMIIPSSQHLVHTLANKTALSQFCEFPDGLLDCEVVSELYLSCW